MQKKRILLVNEALDLKELFQRGFEELGTAVISIKDKTRLPANIGARPFTLVIVEATKGWIKVIQRLSHRKANANTYFIIASPSMLKATATKIKELANEIFENGPGPAALSKSEKKTAEETYLADFVEKKFKDFIRRMKASDSRDLYPVLIKEFEKSFITLTLKETHGNQIRAAQLLGVNRNTLRKKIKELRIVIKKD